MLKMVTPALLIILGDEDFRSANGEDTELELEKLDVELHLAEAAKTSSRGKGSSGSTSNVFGSKYNGSPLSARKAISARRDTITPRSTATVLKNNPSSSIPLPVKSSGPIKPLLKNARSTSKTSSISIPRPTSVSNKHTLEIQFLNKSKRYQQMRKELLDKQKPVLDMYQNLLQIKKRLEELGKNVTLEEVKLVPFSNMTEKKESHGAGEQVPVEVVSNMKNSIEEIPRTLMDICKNLLSRRALIVELLESVTKSELDVSEVSDKIESLKGEGMQLQSSLDLVIAEHETKINDLVSNWQNLLTDKQIMNADSKIEELEKKLQEQARLTNESNNVIQELHKKLDDKKIHYDKSVAELNGVINTLKEQIKKIEHDLESERKSSVDTKTRMTTNSQAMKSIKTKMTEMENEKKTIETQNTELQRKLRVLQEQVKHKETQWNKEKDEMTKNLKHQENLLQKLTQDKTTFESRLEAVEDQKMSTQEELTQAIEEMTAELSETKQQLETVTQERDEALEKCAEFEQYIARMGLECKENMNKVTCSIDWGKGKRESGSNEAERYIQEVAKDLKIRELEDQIKALERDKMTYHQERMMLLDQSREPTETERELFKQQECVNKYQMLLEESENKLKEKLNTLRSMEVANLRAEIRQLRVRQEALEEQNYNCPTEELQKMVEEGRHKLNELMKKSMESEQKLEQYAGVIEKQGQQMADMENLLRYRENMAGVLKASRDELLCEKASLQKYSQEMRNVLTEINKEGKMKDRLLKDLQEKVDLRERQISKLEKEVRELEANLIMTNEKRFKLQETVGIMEKELQNTKKHVNQLADINTRYENQLQYVVETNFRPKSYAPNCCQLLPTCRGLGCHNMPQNQCPVSPDLMVHNQCNELAFSPVSPNIHQKLAQIRQEFEMTHANPTNYNCEHQHNNENQSIISNGSNSCNQDAQSTNNSKPQKCFQYVNANTMSTFKNYSVCGSEMFHHGNCHHQANSRSLISLSLQKVDFLKTRLDYLTSVNLQLPESKESLQNKSNCTLNSAVKTSSTQTLKTKQSRRFMLKKSLSKILELTAKRYEYLQNQANESYEDLTSLVKLAVNQELNDN